MAQTIPCDLHGEPAAAQFLLSNLDSGDSLGLCVAHLVTFADELREVDAAMREGQESADRSDALDTDEEPASPADDLDLARVSDILGFPAISDGA